MTIIRCDTITCTYYDDDTMVPTCNASNITMVHGNAGILCASYRNKKKYGTSKSKRSFFDVKLTLPIKQLNNIIKLLFKKE